MALRSYQDLEVWQVAMQMVVEVYELTRQFPREEKYGLTSQLRRAAASVPANIAEGYGRNHRGDYLRFLSIAGGSLCEVETFLILTSKLGYASREQLTGPWKSAQSVGRMLRRLTGVLSGRSPKSVNALESSARPQTPDPRPR